MNTLKRIFNLAEIKHLWLLVASMAAFTLALYFNRSYPDVYARAELVIYGAAFIIALLWSVLNYIGHLRISEIYKKHDSIEAFVEKMSMNREEKADLIQYLNDFIADLQEKGNSHDEAVKTAISHFQVQEFTQSQGIKFESQLHYYLIGYTLLFIGIIAIIQCINLIVSLSFILLALCFVFVLYSVAFICLFFLYKLMDVIIAKK